MHTSTTQGLHVVEDGAETVQKVRLERCVDIVSLKVAVSFLS